MCGPVPPTQAWKDETLTNRLAADVGSQALLADLPLNPRSKVAVRELDVSEELESLGFLVAYGSRWLSSPSSLPEA